VRTTRQWQAQNASPRSVLFCCVGGTATRAYRVALDLR
jgi:hypothetical protein